MHHGCEGGLRLAPSSRYMLVVSRWVAGSCTFVMLVAETLDHDRGGVETAWVFVLSRWTGSARVVGHDRVDGQLAEARVVDVVREWVTTRRLARVVVPPLHHFERGKGMQRCAFVVRKRWQYSKSTPRLTMVKWGGASTHRTCDESEVPVRGLVVRNTYNIPWKTIKYLFERSWGPDGRRRGREGLWWWLRLMITNVEQLLMDVVAVQSSSPGYPKWPVIVRNGVMRLRGLSLLQVNNI